LRRAFKWKFWITEFKAAIQGDIQRPILGADFLSHYGLLVGIKNKCLTALLAFHLKESYPKYVI